MLKIFLRDKMYNGLKILKYTRNKLMISTIYRPKKRKGYKLYWKLILRGFTWSVEVVWSIGVKSQADKNILPSQQSFESFELYIYNRNIREKKKVSQRDYNKLFEYIKTALQQITYSYSWWEIEFYLEWKIGLIRGFFFFFPYP